ncbi:MAG: Ger(x)C family spore germination protein [Syntrophomonadaceae bacterium]|jgi:spore germination protein KC
MKKLLVLLLLTVFLSGCGKIELNNATIPLAFGLDSQKDEILVTTQLANLSMPKKAQAMNTSQFKVITTRGKTVAEASRNFNLNISAVPLWSQTQIAVLGENLSRQDITPIVDFLVRNRYVRKNDLIMVSHQASPEEILSVKPYLEPYTAIALKNILKIQEGQVGIYPPISANEFIQKLSTPGVEPVLPMVGLKKIGDSHQVELSGMAVFKKNRMTGQLNELESRGYFLMRPEIYYGGLFPVFWDKGEKQWLTIEINSSKAEVIPQIQQQQLLMKIKIKADGTFYDQGGSGNLFTREMFRQVEKACEKEIARQLSMCIQKAQLVNSDFLGWGQIVARTEPEFWKSAGPQWDNIFPTVPYELDISFKIRRSYETDKTFVFR